MTNQNTQLEVKTNNAISQGRYTFTALEVDLMYCTLYLLRESDFKQTQIDIDVNALQQFGVQEIKRARLVDTLRKLVSKKIEIDVEGGDFKVFHFISEAQYFKESNTVRVHISPLAMQFYTPLQSQFTLLDLKILLGLTSKFSKRMYILLSQFKSAQSLRISILDLKQELGLYHPKDIPEKLVNYAQFESKVLKIAQQDFIDNGADITFTYSPSKRERKKVVELIFGIYPTKNYKVDIDKDGPVFRRLIEEFKLSPYAAETIMRNISIAEINHTLYYITLVKDKIQDIGAYTYSKFTKAFQLPLTLAEKNST